MGFMLCSSKRLGDSPGKHFSCGASNTKFFHIATLIRRKKNQIEALQNDHGMWIEDVVELTLAVKFYEELFAANLNTGGQFIKGIFCKLNEA